MPREREFRSELPFYAGIGPAGNVVAQSMHQRVLEIVKPAHGIEIVKMRLGVRESDVLVDEHRVRTKTKIETDQCIAGVMEKDDSPAAAVEKQSPEEVPGQKIEMDFALAIHVQVKLVKTRHHFFSEYRAACRN